jgi:integrase
MSVTVRPYRQGGWMVDVVTRLPNGSRYRDRRRLSIPSKSAAQRWGEERERHLLRHGPPQPEKEAPTLKTFAQRFIDGHARANRQKPSGIAAKEMLLRVHLVPFLGHKRLNAITSEDIQRFKRSLVVKAPKTVNNALTVLSVALKKAVEWDVIERMPCRIKLLPLPKSSASFHDFEQYERLVETASALDRQTELIVLLGGDASLRCGEMIALEWRDVDLDKRQLCVERSDWNGQVTSTKGGRLRYIPLTLRLTTVLREHRHLRSPRVLCEKDGTPFTRQMVQARVKRASRRANVREGVHILRHTFCSHLAMRGAPARAIQELAGHSELQMTQRYMHLSPAALDAAIQLLDGRGHGGARGSIVATSSVDVVDARNA